MATKVQGINYDLKEDWSPANLNAIYPSFPVGYNANPPARTKFNENKDLKQVFSLGLAEESIEATLDACCTANPGVITKVNRSAKGYVGDANYGFKKNFAMFKKLNDNDAERVAAPVESWHMVPSYPMTGFVFQHTRGWEVDDGRTETSEGLSTGTLYGKDQLLCIMRGNIWEINRNHALNEIWDIAKWYALSKIAAYNGDTTYANSLSLTHTQKCNNFANFR